MLDSQYLYVYPNTSELNKKGRGGLSKRWELALKNGCSFIEVPADFIKNKTEISLTGLDLGSFLDKDAVSMLYDNSSIPHEMQYILHSEPSLPRADGYGLVHQSPLRWNEKAWVRKLAQMLISISIFFNLPPYAIEIHPGDKRNNFDDLIFSINVLAEEFDKYFGIKPLILLENRTGQFISTGNDFVEFWNYINKNMPGLTYIVGIVVDLQQLFTQAIHIKAEFIDQFCIIPDDAIKAAHIHSKHRTPSLNDDIPWGKVFIKLGKGKNPLLINPEVHHRKQVSDTIDFCTKFLSEQVVK